MGARPGRCTAPVHPRVCGELPRLADVVGRRTGSSPRVRGTRHVPHLLAAGARFIPACAGNSRAGADCGRCPAVHPRVCGELRPTTIFGALNLRFIPACAGNSPRAASMGTTASVHPRVCGELRFRHRRIRSERGSSPRVRGTPMVGGTEVAGVRFIPACAGNSPDLRRQATFQPVHPRVCGELVDSRVAALTEDGSSPRVRGTPAFALLFRRVGRFIPACAGNSEAGQRTLLG